jgi:hypothetical protein
MEMVEHEEESILVAVVHILQLVSIPNPFMDAFRLFVRKWQLLC